MQVAKTMLLCVVLVSVLQGCASHIVSAEHSAIRNELIGLHEEQAMDNLICPRFWKMLRHMYYTEASATGGAVRRGESGLDAGQDGQRWERFVAVE